MNTIWTLVAEATILLRTEKRYIIYESPVVISRKRKHFQSTFDNDFHICEEPHLGMY